MAPKSFLVLLALIVVISMALAAPCGGCGGGYGGGCGGGCGGYRGGYGRGGYGRGGYRQGGAGGILPLLALGAFF